MDIRKVLSGSVGKRELARLVRFVGSDPDRFKELIHVLKVGTSKQVNNASWAISYCVEGYPPLAPPYLRSLIRLVNQDSVSDAVKRNVVRLLQFVDVPESLAGDVADTCLRFLQSGGEPIAVRVFSMTVLHNLSKTYPELGTELKLILEDQMPFGSAGFLSRAKKLLKSLEKSHP